MKRKILFTSLAILTLVTCSIIGIFKIDNPALADTEVHRLAGLAQDGMMWTQPEPAQFSFFRILVMNPNKNVTMTLIRLRITNAHTGDLVLELTPDPQNSYPFPATLEPLNVYARDSNELGLQHDYSHWQWYTVELFYSGGGLPLQGWIDDFGSVSVKQDKKTGQWQMISLDNAKIVERQMTDYVLPPLTTPPP
jgi:hypothetical protein